MKILLVDDDYQIFSQIIKTVNENSELIETETAVNPRIALQIIKNHPEADIILLDNCFRHFKIEEMAEPNYEEKRKKYSCLEIIEFLNPIETAKIIFFGTDPDRLKNKLIPFGVKHFPGKLGNYWDCINSQCSC